MRNRFDHLAKELGQEALGPAGVTVAHDAINPETQYADLRHEPDPARQAERDRLGLLGELSAVACILEVYSGAPSAEEFRACLTKHLASWQQRVRKARSESKKRDEPLVDDAAAPFLWIIAARTPTTLLTRLALDRSSRWPAGVYLFGADVLRVGIVAAGELPRDSTTLLIRLMAGGPLLAPAVRELAALPRDAYERILAEPVLLHFQHALGQDPSRTPDEKEFLMTMLQTWEDARTEGLAVGRANALLTVLRARGIAVSDAARERILAQRDTDQMQRWLEKATVASTIAEVIDDPK